MKLLALHCPRCESPLIPDNDHVVTVCDRCQTTVHIGDEGLTPILVHYVAPAFGASVTRRLPFWVFEGQVHIIQRQTQGGNAERQSRQLWHKPRTLYVPAWELSLATAQSMGSALIQQQPVYQVDPQPAASRLTPVIVTAEDALKLLEFMILAIEARRPDWLRNLDFRLEVNEPELWALPADDSGVVAFEG